MSAKINKALDYNKLLEAQAQGKQKKKRLQYPILANIKYDGNYVIVTVANGKPSYLTSGGLTYTHTDKGGVIFDFATDGVYIAERISKDGKLGRRRECSLTGPKSDQKSTGHTYKVFDWLTFEEYEKGSSIREYPMRAEALLLYSNIPKEFIAEPEVINDEIELQSYLRHVVNDGYEGIMLMDALWCWTDTKSRTIKFCKYKQRKTVDLLCIGVKDGTGKYTDMIGSLTLTDSMNRIVDVGSGLDDYMRSKEPTYFIGKVIEIEYEQIMDTYIQPSFVSVRLDKTEDNID